MFPAPAVLTFRILILSKGCGNELGAQTVQAADNNCQMACNGDHTQFCGGSNRLTLYHFEEPVVEDPEDPEVPV